MKTKRILASTIILLLIASLFTACSTSGSKRSSASSGQKKTIGVLMCDFSDQFQVYLMDSMKQEAKKYAGDNINFVYEDGKYDTNTQMNQMETLIGQGVDAIILMAVDTKAVLPMVKEAANANIPVITVNRRLDDPSLAVSFIGSDSIQSGELEMQTMATLLHGKGNIAILEGQMGQEPQIKREQGIKNILAKYPDIHIVADQAADWYRDKGMAVTENWLQSNLKIDAIVAHNDEMAIGAEKAIANTGKSGKILVCGIDGTPQALQQVKSGAQAFTIFQNSMAQGKTAVDVAVKVVKGEKVDKEYIIPYELVTPDKVDEYMARYNELSNKS